VKGVTRTHTPIELTDRWSVFLFCVKANQSQAARDFPDCYGWWLARRLTPRRKALAAA
jgi:hypothetical protein